MLIGAPGPLLMVTVLATAVFTGVRMGLILVVVAHGGSPLAAGAITSCMMLVPVFASVWIGRWADRSGHVGPCLAGTGSLAAGAALAAAAAGHHAALALAAVALGSGQALVSLSVMRATGAAAGPSGSARAFSLLALCHSLGGFAGPLLTGVAIDGIGYPVAFAAWCVPELAAGALAIRNPIGQVSRTVANSAAGPGLLTLPRIRSLLLASAMVTIAWDTYTFVTPLREVALGFSATEAGILAGCFALGSLVVRLVLAPMASRFGEERILHGVLVTSVCGYVLYVFAGSLAALMLVGTLLGILLGAGQPLSWSLLHASAPHGRAGEALGSRAVLVSVSQAGLPLLFGFLGAKWGTTPLLLAVAGVILLGTALSRRLS